MKKKLLQGLALSGALFMIVGCGCGNAVEGASPEQVKAEVDKQPPLQQIRNIMMEPTPPSQKEARIKAIEDKYGVKRGDAMKNLPPVKFNMQPPPEVPTGK
ncbi:MAG: hypothetical protein P4L46_15965 [Fimbriimonas sp.]|nr:hypothetical protein [Fimbriimonas sp.]